MPLNRLREDSCWLGDHVKRPCFERLDMTCVLERRIHQLADGLQDGIGDWRIGGYSSVATTTSILTRR